MIINGGCDKVREVPSGTLLVVTKCNCSCHKNGGLHIQACCDNGYYLAEVETLDEGPVILKGAGDDYPIIPQ